MFKEKGKTKKTYDLYLPGFLCVFLFSGPAMMHLQKTWQGRVSCWRRGDSIIVQPITVLLLLLVVSSLRLSSIKAFFLQKKQKR